MSFNEIAVCFALIAQAAFSPSVTADPSSTNEIDRSNRVTLSGNVPIKEFPNIQRNTDKIWSYLTRHLDLAHHIHPPVIQFDPFDRNIQTPEWTSWQKTWTRTHPVIWRDWTALRLHDSSVKISQKWIDANIDEIFPFPDNFLAFHYDGTNRIQINQDRTFLASMQIDPYGMRRDLDGYGYYSVAHEMLHYALEVKGIVPTKLHHCLMLVAPEDQGTSGLMEQVADHLVEIGTIAAVSRYRGLSTERALAPCERLTADERDQVERLHAKLTRRMEPVISETGSQESRVVESGAAASDRLEPALSFAATPDSTVPYSLGPTFAFAL